MEACCGQDSAGRDTCELPSVGFERPARHKALCPQCEGVGKPVSILTVKSMLAVSLRSLSGRDYLFCPSEKCSVVYFTADHSEAYGLSDVRERVYQKEPEADNVSICYCFRHTVGEVRAARDEARQLLLQDIRDGIQRGQCACDVRNPQGSCCLGNVVVLGRALASAGA